MKKELLLQFVLIFQLFIIIKSKDNHTLSNYEEITLVNLTGIFYPDFEEKIVNGDLTYTFQAKKDGENIILDTYNLEIISIKEIKQENVETVIEGYSFGDLDEKLGKQLIIPIIYEKDAIVRIKINYNTTSKGSAALFLSKEQTIGKKHPYFFTISEMTYGRELLPSQDTPAVKFPFYLGIKVMNPLRGMISGLFVKKDNDTLDNTTIYYYEQKIPVPNYLIALAAGNIVEREIDEYVSIYSEPEFVDLAKEEFDDAPDFLKNAISLLGEYMWGKYNILVLPHSFPYSGMENPCLTFTSPCLVNGDKSLVDLIVHELIHSWSGNLVTNENWRDFWLNEGITKYLQRKVVAMWRGDDYAKMDYMLGLTYISKYVNVFTELDQLTLTTLRPNLTGMRPDESYSNIPYEKGSNFMYYLESIVGKDIMISYFQSYFKHFGNKSLDVFEFMDYFKNFCKDKVDDTTMDKILWDEWIFGEGGCPVENNFTNKYDDALKQVLDKFMKGDLSDLEKEFNGLSSSAKTVFFLRLEDRNIFLTEKQHEFLTNKLKLYDKQNFLITTHYLRLILKETEKFLPNEFECLENYLTTFGVTDFMDGVYRLFYKRDEIKAEEILNSCKNFYHSIMYNMAESEINDAKKSFPILSIDLEEDNVCKQFSKDDKIKLAVELVNPIDDVKIKISEGIYLHSEKDRIDLICYYNFTDEGNYCYPKEENIRSGEYNLIIPDRIQKENYAIRNIDSVKKYKLYVTDFTVDESFKGEYEFDYGKKEQTLKIAFLDEPDEGIHLMNGNSEISCTIISEKKTMECRLNENILPYDKENPEKFKVYNLTLYDLCGNEKYSFQVKVKKSPVEEEDNDDGGLAGWAIALIVIFGVIAFLIIAFFVYRFIRRKSNQETKVIDISEDKKMTDQ